MLTLPLGLALVIGFLALAVFGVNVDLLYNNHSMLLVFFGTLTIFILSTPSETIHAVWRSLVALWKREANPETLNRTLLSLGENKVGKVDGDHHPLIALSSDLWQQGVDDELFLKMTQKKLSDLNQESREAVLSLRNLSKYPPSLGMIGTVIGLVALFANLNLKNKEIIGPNLSLALTATFYGLITSNLILLPLSDRLQGKSLKDNKKNEYVFRILMLIHDGEPLSVIKQNII